LSAIAMATKSVGDVIIDSDKKTLETKSHSGDLDEPRRPSEIRFVRNRMFYARPTLNAAGAVRLGLRHIRKSNPPNSESKFDSIIRCFQSVRRYK
jgi:hypothetical protein